MSQVIIIGIVVLILAYMLQGISGFGRSLVATPILSLFIPANEVIAIMILTGILANTIMLIKTLKYSDIKKIWLMIIMGIIGVSVGVWLLTFTPVKQLKIGMGIMVVSSAIMIASGFKLKIKEGVFSYSIAGLSSGVLTGLLSMGGPPIVFFLQNQNHEKHQFRGNLSVFFFFTGSFALISLFANHLITYEVVTKSIYFLPASVIGIISGDYLAHKVNEKIFKKIIVGILFLSGISAIITSFI